jgi:excinuclease ABC subunit A
VLYVLDEPSIGLHQRDNDMLLATLRRLRDLGNTVLVVEHDEDAIRTADYVIDMGPGRRAWRPDRRAGHAKQLLKSKTSVTADYLNGTRDRGARQAPQGLGQEADRAQGDRQQPPGRDREHPAGHLHLHHRRVGSGKSSFTIDTLYAAAARTLNGARILAASMRRSGSNISTR